MIFEQLFIGAPNFTSSPLHRDVLSSSFFSIQFQGIKTWRIYHSKDAAFLYPSLKDDVHFLVTDVHDVTQQKKYPLLKFARYVDIDVHPGELLYVPGGCPHQVLSTSSSNNASITIMLGMNVINYADVENVIQTTKPKRMRWKHSEELYTKEKYEPVYNFFSKYQNEFLKLINWEVDDMPWRDFTRRDVSQI